VDFQLVGWAKIKADQFQVRQVSSAGKNRPVSVKKSEVASGSNTITRDETLSLDYVPDIDSSQILKKIARGFSNQIIGNATIPITIYR
jgi:hypothetical protein